MKFLPAHCGSCERFFFFLPLSNWVLGTRIHFSIEFRFSPSGKEKVSIKNFPRHRSYCLSIIIVIHREALPTDEQAHHMKSTPYSTVLCRRPLRNASRLRMGYQRKKRLFFFC
ncbi:hypothetical protein BP00DRAFT_178831 [Aspergillus indologenus CBS 114.80]|uniref:Uncharacterized protein n=1 Tax=Aspergillus indologenus CBS 114.80 TaxID=1450541 RepID=A0A2V5I802_9EURO|nr:hypothetical protein BP00DRAFT_178831 [Aspergillus indologenus CBS 114.80]